MARSRWLIGMVRSLAIVTRTVTTTYVSRAASSTAAPPTPMAVRRPRAGSPSVTAPGAVAVTSGRGGTGRHRRVAVLDRPRDRGGRRPGPARHREDRLAQPLVLGVQPELAGHAD